MVSKVKVLKFYVHDLVYVLDYLELYCIKKGFSYVKLPNEFHFINYVFQFYSHGALLDEDPNIMDFEEVFFGFSMLKKPFKVKALGLKLKNTESFFPLKKNERNLSCKTGYKVNTMGYSKRMRRR